MSIPSTARAAVLKAFGQPLDIEAAHPVPQPSSLAPNECLIRIEYAGMCHSDVHIQKGGWAKKATVPLVLGHEGIGRIVAIGEHTSNSGGKAVKVGDMVGVKWLGRICGSCEYCRKGFESCCPVSSGKCHGFQIDGVFADYVVSYVEYVTPIPAGLDGAIAAPILCAGLTIYKALKKSNATVGQWVAISGAGGGLGHLGVQYAVAMGLRVPAIDTGEAKHKLCLELGAEAWVDYMESKDVVQDVQQTTCGGPHAAIIAVGNEKPFHQALLYLRLAGTLVGVGVPEMGPLLNVPFSLLIGKNLRILGSTVGNQQDMIEALDFVARGKVKPRIQIRHLEDVNAVMKDLDDGKIAGRVVLKL